MHILCLTRLQTSVETSAARQKSQSGVQTCHISRYLWVNLPASLHPAPPRSPKIQIKLHVFTLDLSTCWIIYRAGSPKSSRKEFAPLLSKTLSGTLNLSLWQLSLLIQQRFATFFLRITSYSNGALCQCGGARDAHASVALGDYFSAAIVNHWDSAQHSSESPTDAFGELQFAGSSKRHSYVGVLSVASELLTFQSLLVNVNFLNFNLLLSRHRSATEVQARSFNATPNLNIWDHLLVISLQK